MPGRRCVLGRITLLTIGTGSLEHRDPLSSTIAYYCCCFLELDLTTASNSVNLEISKFATQRIIHSLSWNIMSSPSDSHRLARRDSSPRADRSSSRRRPRLLRACATEPSITTSSACKGVLTSPNSSRRATELLNRVAVSNAAILSSSPISTRSFAAVDYESSGLTEEEKRELLRSNSTSCKYPLDIRDS